jgi:hypothetical protein
MTAEETRCCDCTPEVTETGEGFRVELKGDKEQLKAGVEAIKALVTCWTEAHAAGCCHSHGFGFPPAIAHAFWHHAGHHARRDGRHHPMRGHHRAGPMSGCCR